MAPEDRRRLRDPVGRRTYTKTRTIAAGTQEMPQPVARVDRFEYGALDPAAGGRALGATTTPEELVAAIDGS